MTNNKQTEDKKVILDATISSIEKQFGKGSVMLFGKSATVESVKAVSTGSLSLDLALGIGGLPRGRIIEIFGAESAGKSTLAMSVVAQAQKRGGSVAYVDAEHALDPTYARTIGVDLDGLYLSQPDSAEQALEITSQLVSSGALDVVVIDSVAALVPQAEIDGEMGDMQVGAQARLMSKAMRKLTGIISKTGTSVIFINQLRQKVGVVFGNPEVTSGGQALKFYSSVRIDLRRIESLKSGAEVVGIKVRARVVKNKVAPPFRVAEFNIIFGVGIVREAELIDLGVKHNIVRRAGAHYFYGDNKLGQGTEMAAGKLKEDADLANEIETAIVTKVQKAA